MANAIPGFTVRASQQKMARAVHSAIQQQTQLVVEAGTGTGKTYAYLIPALRSKQKVVISTGSKTLQDQLYYRDLPTVAAAINFSGRAVLLKGRANYLCLQRLEQQLQSTHHFETQCLADIVTIRHWSAQTQHGDINDCADVEEHSLAWPLVTSTNDNCLGSDCPHYQECFVFKARQRALEADIVIVNHHLFLADKIIKESGYAALIPKASVVILDEAHQLPEIASHYFGESLSSRQLLLLAKDLCFSYQSVLTDMVSLPASAEILRSSVQSMQLVLGLHPYRADWGKILQKGTVQQSLIQLQEALAQCCHVIKQAVKRDPSLDNMLERAVGYHARLQRLQQVEITGYSYWYEATAHYFTLAFTPLSVAEQFQIQMQAQPAAWIFTSATLAVDQNIEHFSHCLGLTDPKVTLLSSPFNYRQQALLCVPRHLPGLHQSAKLAQQLTPLLEANQGGTLFLCTSYARLHALAIEFRACLPRRILVQGEASKSALLNQFIQSDRALLLATSSFWEGIDLPGQRLSCVIIDKLPFTVPNDPVLQARVAHCRLQGDDPFMMLQIPAAVIALKQGVGRLIRTNSDRGVLVICDHRLVARPYGALFLASLPPLPRTRDLIQAIDFFSNASIRQQSDDRHQNVQRSD